MMDEELPRYAPGRPLPPYAYVPGRAPHPTSDERGHSYGVQESPPTPLAAANWQANETYLHAIDLFNRGYYWEAHEAWEGLWHMAQRQGPLADFLKGLIKLAAAGVKAREGRAAGVRRHALRAADLLEHCQAALGAQPYGLSLPLLIEIAGTIAREAEPLALRASLAAARLPFELFLDVEPP
jgi:uncharacterized protein